MIYRYRYRYIDIYICVTGTWTTHGQITLCKSLHLVLHSTRRSQGASH